MSGEEDVPSPCTKVCTLDPRTGFCAGCHRTLDEIARWSELTNAERRQVLARLPARRARTGSDSR